MTPLDLDGTESFSRGMAPGGYAQLVERYITSDGDRSAVVEDQRAYLCDSAPPHQEPAVGQRERLQRGMARVMATTTPTLLPELLRAFSQQAGHLASHPINAFDNNPFITREWLIVSQVLQIAARSLENRFEMLFLRS